VELLIEKAQLPRGSNDLPYSFDVFCALKFGCGHSEHSSSKLCNFTVEEFQHKLQSVGAQAVKGLNQQSVGAQALKGLSRASQPS